MSYILLISDFETANLLKNIKYLTNYFNKPIY